MAKVRLADLTTARIQARRLKRLEANNGDMLKAHSARVSLNTLLRSTKSLFGPKTLKELGLEVPNKEVYEKAPARKYVPEPRGEKALWGSRG